MSCEGRRDDADCYMGEGGRRWDDTVSLNRHRNAWGPIQLCLAPLGMKCRVLYAILLELPVKRERSMGPLSRPTHLHRVV